MKIKYELNVYKFLKKNEIDNDTLLNMLDNAIYYAEQNSTYEASKCGTGGEELAVLASLKIAEYIKETFGEVKIFAKMINGQEIELNETQYCEVLY